MAEQAEKQALKLDAATQEKDARSTTAVHEADDSPLSVVKDLDVRQKWRLFDKSPEERRFLFKLNAVVLTLACLGSFIKYLDEVNLSNAFVFWHGGRLAPVQGPTELQGDQVRVNNLVCLYS